MVRALASLLLASALLAGCSESRSPKKCREVCEIEARCAEEREEREESETFRFDKGECIAACTALERDVVGREIVEEHADCVLARAGGSCEQIQACR